MNIKIQLLIFILVDWMVVTNRSGIFYLCSPLFSWCNVEAAPAGDADSLHFL